MVHRGRTLRAGVVLVTAATLAGVGCTSSDESGAPSTAKGGVSTTAAPKYAAPPAGLPAFYGVPDPLRDAPAGALLKSEKVAEPELHGTVYRVMYTSRSVRNETVAVTGIVIVPKGPAPANGYPVVTWGHGTNGMADKCAPSLRPESAVPLANSLLDRGWLVVASDYEGEGTPGLMPYIAGISEARSTIDIVRAARQLDGSQASNEYVVWGHSQGGHTAMFALDMAAAYAPELQLRGVVAGAPPSQFALIYAYLKESPYRYYLLMAAGGLNAAHGDDAAPLDEVLTPEGLALLPELEKGCADYLSDKLGNISTASVTKADPFTVPAWRKILAANDPANFTTPAAVPLLMIQGGSDEQIPTASTQLLATQLCTIGQQLERWIYPGQSHAGVIAVSGPDMVHWISDRYSGVEKTYVPTGQDDIQRTACPR